MVSIMCVVYCFVREIICVKDKLYSMYNIKEKIKMFILYSF